MSICVNVSGKDRSGKSTVLLLIAQCLRENGYRVVVPETIRFLGVDKTILNVGDENVVSVELV